MEKYEVIVIGAGPAGLICAGRAAERGFKVLVLEKMKQEGRKLLITGKGRCNITNDAPMSDFIRCIHPVGKFSRPAFSAFFNKDILALLAKNGMEAKLERGGRYFPRSDKSSDVLQALLKYAASNGVKIIKGTRAGEIITRGHSVQGVMANNTRYTANNVVIATGGKSYPATGSTGDGYELAKQAGHQVVTPRPSLVPLDTKGELAAKWQGISLKNVQATIWVDNKKQGEGFGEMIFTHFGLSGPIILTLSRIAVDALNQSKNVRVTIDMKPALDEQKLDNRLIRDLNENGKKKLANMFRSWLPSGMITGFIESCQLDPGKECHQVNAQERKKIRLLMKSIPFEISGYRSFKEAIVTAGGVSLDEVSPKTMQSKLVKGLYFAGEVLDLDAETGGYNLQIAWSTGWLAGNSVSS